MSYQETRTPWRKLWRKEPELRKAGLSYHARTLLVFLLRHADDKGCLGPASPEGHAARHLGQMLAVAPRNRKAFYREMDELLTCGDDGEPLALVIRDSHFFLTRFEECQAKRTKVTEEAGRDKVGTEQGQGRDKTGTEQGQSLSVKPTESFNTETDLPTEVRRKKKEVRELIKPEALKEGMTGDASLVANPSADGEPGSIAKEVYSRCFRERYGKDRTNLDKYASAFEQTEAHARQQPGDVTHVLVYLYRAFFAADDQTEWGQHSPTTLAGQGFFRYVKGYGEELEAAEQKRRGELAQQRHEAAKEAANAEHLQGVKERARQRAQNGAGHGSALGGNLGPDLAEWKL